jgi:hypothetical protein
MEDQTKDEEAKRYAELASPHTERSQIRQKQKGGEADRLPTPV